MKESRPDTGTSEISRRLASLEEAVRELTDVLRSQTDAERESATNARRSPYMSAREAMAYLRINSYTALYSLIREHSMPTCRRGRLYVFDIREIDAWLRGFASSIELARAKRRLGTAVTRPRDGS